MHDGRQHVDPVVVNYVLDGWNPATEGGVGTSNVSVRMDLKFGRLFGNAVHVERPGRPDRRPGRLHGRRHDGVGEVVRAGPAGFELAEVLDSRGQVLNALTYDAYGNILTETDATRRGRYAWTGRDRDARRGCNTTRHGGTILLWASGSRRIQWGSMREIATFIGMR